MIHINRLAPIGHVETDPARKEWAKACYGPDISREFTGDNAAGDAWVWIREIEMTDKAPGNPYPAYPA